MSLYADVLLKVGGGEKFSKFCHWELASLNCIYFQMYCISSEVKPGRFQKKELSPFLDFMNLYLPIHLDPWC